MAFIEARKLESNCAVLGRTICLTLWVSASIPFATISKTPIAGGDVKHKWKILASVLAAIAAFNASVALPVSSKLAEDPKNRGVFLVAHRSLLVHPTDITLNLLGAEGAAPIDLFRHIFQSAAVLKDRKFGQVHLYRGFTHVYSISGADFQALGREFDAGQNPVYLIRTLPEKLLLPNGDRAFGTWTGGMLGVLKEQMEEVTEAARTWAGS